MNKNKATLKAFITFCEANPELRFWQALREFCGANYILFVDDIDHETGEVRIWKDTFYLDGINN